MPNFFYYQQVGHYTPAVVQTISNPDGTVSIIQVDPSNPVITLPDGTTAQIQGIAQLDPAQSGGVHTLAEVATATEFSQVAAAGQAVQAAQAAGQQIVVPSGAENGHILITGEDGQGEIKINKITTLLLMMFLIYCIPSISCSLSN